MKPRCRDTAVVATIAMPALGWCVARCYWHYFAFRPVTAVMFKRPWFNGRTHTRLQVVHMQGSPPLGVARVRSPRGRIARLCLKHSGDLVSMPSGWSRSFH